MERQLRMGGGIMNAMPREQYGLGSLVKSIGKGVKKAVSGVKDFAKSDLGKAVLLYAGGTYLGGTSALGGAGGSFMSRLASPSNLMNLANIPSYLGGKVSGIPGASKVSNFFKGDATLGKTAAMFAGGSLLGGLASAAESGDEEAVAATRDVNALRSYLEKGYRNLNYSEDEIPALVESDVAEYSAGQGGYANGGRIGYALGTPEQNAIEAAGIMNLPLNQNPAGVTELDLRETGGFIPPVGVKEKADDIPAMLANNEFVFTADAVRGMGDGNVNKGAQRMYDMMKKLEKGGRV
tara:strand:- start:1043 stop:1924 length:882 start_codon:yes stop_codon:yes gene_type:complete